jgi:hypothetical protein
MVSQPCRFLARNAVRWSLPVTYWILPNLVGCRGATIARPDAPSTTVVHEAGGDAQIATPIVINNEGAGQISLQADVSLNLATLADIEVREDGHWRAYGDVEQGKGYRLVESCSPSPATCLSISPGQRFTPVRWSGFTCSAQCAPPCRSDVFHPGVHRFVVHACTDPMKRYEGPPFEMAASAGELARWRASSDIHEVTTVKLDPRNGEDVAFHHSDRVAGYRVLPGTAQPLETGLVGELAKWLRSERGFKDNVARRCVRDHMVGFLLARHGSEATEVAVDFACNSMILVTPEARGRIETVAFLDSCRPELLSILLRARPSDQDFANLR